MQHEFLKISWLPRSILAHESTEAMLLQSIIVPRSNATTLELEETLATNCKDNARLVSLRHWRCHPEEEYQKALGFDFATE